MIKIVKLSFATMILLFGLCMVLPLQNVSAQPPNKKDVEKAKKFFQEAEKLYNQRKYKQAIVKYDQSIAAVRRNPIANYRKGLAHYELKEFAQAISAWDTSLNEEFQAPGEIYKVRWAIYFNNKDYDSALKDLESALKYFPNDNYLLVSAGDIYREKNMDREAVNMYEKAAPTAPNSADLYYAIAFTYAKLGEPTPQGVAALQAVQKGTRFLGESWFLIGDSFQRARKFNEAAEAYEKAISAKPDFVNSFINLSQVYQILNRMPDAIATAKKGIQFHPNDGTLYTNLSWFNSLVDSHVEAVTAGKKAIALLPNESMGYTNLCRAYNDLKRYDLAVDSCTTALNLSPNDGETNFYMARAMGFQNKKDVAATHYKKAVKGLIEFTKNNPDYADGFYLLGNSYYETDQMAEAIGAFKKCLAISPGFTKAIFNLGVAYFVKGDKTSARAQQLELAKYDAKRADDLLKIISGK